MSQASASLQPPTHGEARDGRQHRLAHLADLFPVARDEGALVDIHVAPVGHRRDVGAGGEGLVAAGDDDGAHAGSASKASKGNAERVHQRIVERIELRRAVEPDQPDAAPRSKPGWRISHACSGSDQSTLILLSRITAETVCPRTPAGSLNSALSRQRGSAPSAS